MEYSEALARKIEARITELKSEIAAHERALAALRGRPAQPEQCRRLERPSPRRREADPRCRD